MNSHQIQSYESVVSLRRHYSSAPILSARGCQTVLRRWPVERFMLFRFSVLLAVAAVAVPMLTACRSRRDRDQRWKRKLESLPYAGTTPVKKETASLVSAEMMVPWRNVFWVSFIISCFVQPTHPHAIAVIVKSAIIMITSLLFVFSDGASYSIA